MATSWRSLWSSQAPETTKVEKEADDACDANITSFGSASTASGADGITSFGPSQTSSSSRRPSLESDDGTAITSSFDPQDQHRVPPKVARAALKCVESHRPREGEEGALRYVLRIAKEAGLPSDELAPVEKLIAEAEAEATAKKAEAEPEGDGELADADCAVMQYPGAWAAGSRTAPPMSVYPTCSWAYGQPPPSDPKAAEALARQESATCEVYSEQWRGYSEYWRMVADGKRRDSAPGSSVTGSRRDSRPKCGADVSRAVPNEEEAPRTKDEVPNTTIMLKNLPNDFTRDTLLKLLDCEQFSGKYDAVYVPFDFCNKRNLGYAFVNMVTPGDYEKLWERFEGLEVGSKVCEVREAVHQGKDSFVEKFRNNPVMHESIDEVCKPVLFENGVKVPFPAADRKIRAPRFKFQQDSTG